MENGIRIQHNKRLFIQGCILASLGVAGSALIAESQLKIYADLTAAMVNDKSSELILAALKLVVMNVIRMIPHYPGVKDSTLTEQISYAITNMIDTLDIEMEMHEASPEYPTINATVAHERAMTMASMGIPELQMAGVDMSLEPFVGIPAWPDPPGAGRPYQHPGPSDGDRQPVSGTSAWKDQRGADFNREGRLL